MCTYAPQLYLMTPVHSLAHLWIAARCPCTCTCLHVYRMDSPFPFGAKPWIRQNPAGLPRISNPTWSIVEAVLRCPSAISAALSTSQPLRKLSLFNATFCIALCLQCPYNPTVDMLVFELIFMYTCPCTNLPWKSFNWPLHIPVSHRKYSRVSHPDLEHPALLQGETWEGRRTRW